jgi:DNA-binding NarL/FixJ family response regulator
MKNIIVVVGGCSWGNIGLEYLVSDSHKLITVHTPMEFMQLADNEEVSITTLCLRLDNISSLSTYIDFMQKILMHQKTSHKYDVIVLTTLPQCALWGFFYALGANKVLSYHSSLNTLISELTAPSDLKNTSPHSVLYKPFLSRRELMVLSGWMKGQSINELANELDIAQKTLYHYRKCAIEKLGAPRIKDLQFWLASLC